MRFADRRGRPSKIISDNGTNLALARNELAKTFRQLDHSKIIRAARQQNIEWIFNPPLASHQGGIWERMIRTVRRVLCAVLDRNVRLSDDVLHTVMCNVENIVNSHLISKLSDDVDDDTPLTPNHVLLLHSNPALSWGTFFSCDMYRKRWRFLQYLCNRFWKILREYLPQPQTRSKWLNEMSNLKVGYLVLVCDESSPRVLWPLGLVIAVAKGRYLKE